LNAALFEEDKKRDHEKSIHKEVSNKRDGGAAVRESFCGIRVENAAILVDRDARSCENDHVLKQYEHVQKSSRFQV
jgi:hypothetical protein